VRRLRPVATLRPVYPPAFVSSAASFTSGHVGAEWITSVAVAAAGLAVGGYHYAALWPASRLFGSSVIAGADPAEVALTFDDGPNDPYTGQLIDVLARQQVRATFFVIGRYAQEKPQIVRALNKAGHVIGSHTMTHPRLMYMTPARIQAEIAGGTARIEDIIGNRVRFFRPPFGARHPGVFRVLEELRLTPVLWNVNSRDWKARSAAELEIRLERGIVRNQRLRRGSNILMHDGGHLEMGTDRRRTVTATANLLAMGPRGGIRFVSVDRWHPAAPGIEPPR
jgi:peptidoglycan-N-acetylglucosamine deacetylase